MYSLPCAVFKTHRTSEFFFFDDPRNISPAILFHGTTSLSSSPLGHLMSHFCQGLFVDPSKTSFLFGPDHKLVSGLKLTIANPVKHLGKCPRLDILKNELQIFCREVINVGYKNLGFDRF